MHVNFASGIHPFPAPWRNLDLNDHPGVDERVDLLTGLGSVTAIELAYVGHFLEHLTPPECVGFLRRVRHAMRPGGRIVVVSPDAGRAIAMHEKGAISDDLLKAVGVHGERNGNDVSHIHAWICREDRVRRMLKWAAWERVRSLAWSEFPTLGIPVISDAGWQFALIASAARQ